MSKLLNKYLPQAEALDRNDPLAEYRRYFALPADLDKIYFCNNSLGLPASKSFNMLEKLLKDWSEFGAEGWFNAKTNWYNFVDTQLKAPLSRLLGAHPDEVIVMNSLTVNLHLLLISFYQPTLSRYKIVIEAPAFPSDLYALKSQLENHGLDPKDALITVEPRPGEYLVRQEDLEQRIVEQADSIALVFLNGVNFLTGQVFDIKSISRLAKSKGCIVGVDLAHSAGNIPLQLHDWQVDFAVGCSYKYLCSGPGGPGIAYVHSMHHNRDLHRLAGWWGNDPNTRFQMQFQSEFIPYGGVSAWQLSTPSILAMVPLAASLEIFDQAGILNLRRKSEFQTTFLMKLLNEAPSGIFDVITPHEPQSRGSQLSLLVYDNCEGILQKLEKKGVIGDFRPPNIIRVTPSPLYNTFREIFQFTCRLFEVLGIDG